MIFDSGSEATLSCFCGYFFWLGDDIFMLSGEFFWFGDDFFCLDGNIFMFNCEFFWFWTVEAFYGPAANFFRLCSNFSCSDFSWFGLFFWFGANFLARRRLFLLSGEFSVKYYARGQFLSLGVHFSGSAATFCCSVAYFCGSLSNFSGLARRPVAWPCGDFNGQFFFGYVTTFPDLAAPF